MTEAAPIGSEWYAWRHHWRVTGRTTLDGEPAVYTKCLTCDKRAGYKHPPVMVSRLVRFGKRK